MRRPEQSRQQQQWPPLRLEVPPGAQQLWEELWETEPEVFWQQLLWQLLRWQTPCARPPRAPVKLRVPPIPIERYLRLIVEEPALAAEMTMACLYMPDWLRDHAGPPLADFLPACRPTAAATSTWDASGARRSWRRRLRRTSACSQSLLARWRLWR